LKVATRVLLALALLASPVAASGKDLTLRAGELIACSLNEPNLSSATAEIGEPIVCHIGQMREFGRAAFPRGSYFTGRFADYREPGRIAGKGWLILQFDRLILPDTEIPVSTRVVFVRGFKVDGGGRVLGRGHATRDAIAWSIPILWPIQLMRLPGRGPRPISANLRGQKQDRFFFLPNDADALAPCRVARRSNAEPLQTAQVAQPPQLCELVLCGCASLSLKTVPNSLRLKSPDGVQRLIPERYASMVYVAI